MTCIRLIARAHDAIDFEQLARSDFGHSPPSLFGAMGEPQPEPLPYPQPPAWLLATKERLKKHEDRAAQNPNEHAQTPEDELQRLRQEHTRMAGFDPNRSVMVCGRPVMAPRLGCFASRVFFQKLE